MRRYIGCYLERTHEIQTCVMYYRYSTRCLLNEFPDSKKFKISGVTLNHYQKPLLLYMKHIMCWSNYGDLIIDATSGTGTLAVSYY